MGSEPNTLEFDSLGAYLQKKRREKKLDIVDIVNETKIPSATLLAMEADDYASLPAEAFARGFYVLYAKSLDLNTEQILSRYEKSRGLPPKVNYEATSLNTGEGKPVNSLAAPPAVSLSSLLGFGLVVLVLTIAGISWYMSWNPATFISERLRSFQKPPVEATEETNSTTEEEEKKKDKPKKDLTMNLGPSKAYAAPLVVMEGSQKSHYTRNGIIFITVPSTENSAE